jgi:response regulator RpfG family c-di-GMP phosphodiesterase
MNPRIICVDDEPRVLKGLRRRLGREFDLQIAEGGAEALSLMRSSEPFEVIVSDMRMPVMSGAQLLAQVRQEFPETVRVLLTGQSDLEDAIAAVNEGNIFRFLSKPCPPETLLPALRDAVEHNRLIRSERELLEGTVQGSVSLLSEILAIRDPAAAERGMRLKRHVGGLAEAMGIDRPWDIELAATLSEIGYSLIPSDIVERWHDGDTLTDGEEALLAQQPRVARDLVSRIPRLEVVADMLGQLAPDALPAANPRVKLAVDVINAAMIYDRSIQSGMKEGAAVRQMRETRSDLAPEILKGLEHVAVAAGGYVVKELAVADLVSGVQLAADLYAKDDRLLLAEGTEVTHASLMRINQYADHVGVREPLKVRVPA